MSTPKAIFYDLDGTLRYNDPTGRDFFISYARTNGLEFTSIDRQRSAHWEHAYWAESNDLLTDRAKFPDNSTFWKNYA